MSLDQLRKKQAQIDSKIIKLLEDRFAISLKIGEYKLKKGLKIEDKAVEQEKIMQLHQKHPSKVVDFDFIQKVWRAIFAKSKEIQKVSRIDQIGKK